MIPRSENAWSIAVLTERTSADSASAIAFRIAGPITGKIAVGDALADSDEPTRAAPSSMTGASATPNWLSRSRLMTIASGRCSAMSAAVTFRSLSLGRQLFEANLLGPEQQAAQGREVGPDLAHTHVRPASAIPDGRLPW